MSLVIERFLTCDTKGCESNTVDGYKLHPYAFILRLEAKKNGWYIGAKQDLCPDCVRRKANEEAREIANEIIRVNGMRE